MDRATDQQGTMFVSVDGLCVNGSRIQTTTAQEICTELANDEAGTCLQNRMVVLSTSIDWLQPIQVGEGFNQVCVKKYSIDECNKVK